jgi:hypothetical protein
MERMRLGPTKSEYGVTLVFIISGLTISQEEGGGFSGTIESVEVAYTDHGLHDKF